MCVSQLATSSVAASPSLRSLPERTPLALASWLRWLPLCRPRGRRSRWTVLTTTVGAVAVVAAWFDVVRVASLASIWPSSSSPLASGFVVELADARCWVKQCDGMGLMSRRSSGVAQPNSFQRGPPLSPDSETEAHTSVVSAQSLPAHAIDTGANNFAICGRVGRTGWSDLGSDR